MNYMMNLKSKVILSVSVFLMCLSGPAYSQGLFKNSTPNPQGSTTTTKSTGVFALNQNTPNTPSPGNSPVGEGLAILSLLSGGYFMLKKRNSRKEQ
jgi:hypothetical protein